MNLFIFWVIIFFACVRRTRSKHYTVFFSNGDLLLDNWIQPHVNRCSVIEFVQKLGHYRLIKQSWYGNVRNFFKFYYSKNKKRIEKSDKQIEFLRHHFQAIVNLRSDGDADNAAAAVKSLKRHFLFALCILLQSMAINNDEISFFQIFAFSHFFSFELKPSMM